MSDEVGEALADLADLGIPVLKKIPKDEPLSCETDDPPPSVPNNPITNTKPCSNEDSRMPNILVRSLNATKTAGWDYNPRSDRHSVIKCVGLLFDLIRLNPGLARALHTRDLVFGINSVACGKALDLVIGEPSRWGSPRTPRTLEEIVALHSVHLSADELAAFAAFKDLREGQVVAPRLSVEAKSVMTDHAGALPRLSDELERFRVRLSDAYTMGLVLVNTSEQFVSPGRNGFDPTRPNLVVNHHRQPDDARRVVSMVEGLHNNAGFNALGVVFVECRNDGSPITLRTLDSDPMSYQSMVQQAARAI